MEMKKWLWVLGGVLAFFILVAASISSPLLGVYDKWAMSSYQKDKNSKFARWMEITIGNINRYTLRSDSAAETYKKYVETFGHEDPRSPKAMYDWAVIWSEGGKRSRASEVVEDWLYIYADTRGTPLYDKVEKLKSSLIITPGR